MHDLFPYDSTHNFIVLHCTVEDDLVYQTVYDRLFDELLINLPDGKWRMNLKALMEIAT